MLTGQRVLVVDEISDTEEVLRAVLEPRGMHVDRLHGKDTSIAVNPEALPAVVVIDTESESPSHTTRERWRQVPQVIIGSARIAHTADAQGDAERHYLAKPFQYAELVCAIERLIKRRAA